MSNSIEYSQNQKDFFQALTLSNKNIALKSTAGSGKTTTAVQATKYIPYGKTSLFCAFNKHTVMELKEKLPSNVDCSTLHSLGLKALFNYYPQGSVKVKENKQIQFIEPLFERIRVRKDKWLKIYECDKILRLVRATMTELEEEEIEALCANHNLWPEKEIVISTIIAGTRLKEYNSDPEKYGMEVDFQDMIELCVKDKDIRMPRYDFVFVDECQDCSHLDQLFIERLIKPGVGRLCVIGDPRQAIYSFRGADTYSFEYFENRPNTVTLPLSISYRCSKEVVKNAKKIYTDIEPWEKNKDGRVIEKGKLEDVQKGDFVLARNLRPLIEAFFKLIDLGKKCSIVGKELEEGLLELIEYLDEELSVEDMFVRLDEILLRKENELSRRGMTSPKNHPSYEALSEKIGVLKRVGRNCGSIGQVKELLGTIFNDNGLEAIELMTIHKSKGRENKKVFLINTFEGKKLIPNKYAVTKDQLTQEKNLLFIASTRSQEELHFLDL